MSGWFDWFWNILSNLGKFLFVLVLVLVFVLVSLVFMFGVIVGCDYYSYCWF